MIFIYRAGREVSHTSLDVQQIELRGYPGVRDVPGAFGELEIQYFQLFFRSFPGSEQVSEAPGIDDLQIPKPATTSFLRKNIPRRPH